MLTFNLFVEVDDTTVALMLCIYSVCVCVFTPHINVRAAHDWLGYSGPFYLVVCTATSIMLLLMLKRLID